MWWQRGVFPQWHVFSRIAGTLNATGNFVSAKKDTCDDARRARRAPFWILRKVFGATVKLLINLRFLFFFLPVKIFLYPTLLMNCAANKLPFTNHWKSFFLTTATEVCLYLTAEQCWVKYGTNARLMSMTTCKCHQALKIKAKQIISFPHEKHSFPPLDCRLCSHCKFRFSTSWHTDLG